MKELKDSKKAYQQLHEEIDYAIMKYMRKLKDIEEKLKEYREKAYTK